MSSRYEADYTIIYGFVRLDKVVFSAIPESFDCTSSDASI